MIEITKNICYIVKKRIINFDYTEITTKRGGIFAGT